jgi:hypothetical protein
MKPLNAALKRHPRLRAEQIVQTERCYGPTNSASAPVAVDRDRASFSITEVRLTVTRNLRTKRQSFSLHRRRVPLATALLELRDDPPRP